MRLLPEMRNQPAARRIAMTQGEQMLGVCFGHQLLALLLGGKSERATQGWGVGIHKYKLAAKAPESTHTVATVLDLARLGEVVALQGRQHIAHPHHCAGQGVPQRFGPDPLADVPPDRRPAGR